jgi:hypothetical protein
MSKVKTTPTWEKNNSLLQGIHLIPAALIAHSLDNSAIKQSRRFQWDVAIEVTKRLTDTFKGVQFTAQSVKNYIDAIATDKAIISRWNVYKNSELPLIRQMIVDTK